MSDQTGVRFFNFKLLLIEGEDKDTLYLLKKHLGKERVIVNRQFIFNDPADLRRQISAVPDGTAFVYTHFRRLMTHNMLADGFGVGEGFPIPYMLHQEVNRIYIGYKKCRGMFLCLKHRTAKPGVLVPRHELI